MNLIEAIAKRINEILKEKNIDKRQFCKDNNFSISHFNNILNAKNKDIRSDILARIVRGLGITLFEFFSSNLFSKENLKD